MQVCWGIQERAIICLTMASNRYQWQFQLDVFVKHYAPTICVSIQNAKVEKEHNSHQNTGHLHLGSKLLAKFHEPNSSGSLYILLTKFSWSKFEKGHYSTVKTPTEKKKKKTTTGHNSRSIRQYLFKCHKVIYFSLTIYSLGFKALASVAFEILCWQDFIHILSKGHNSGTAHDFDMKKARVSYFFMRNLYMEFQNPSMHSSEVRVCIKVCNVKMTKGRNSRSTLHNLFKS